ncbi:hypothetical protein CY34DRAFT_102102 [Suillus luteus UH-Slu-Lm8-n1]|uniref:Uncharacterized protein n=1 Tax=Suillus luteus UH-Slu-Lm8-n1 TaxID=930992 RepID=A0A0C9ZSA9_9AGAM|nr:hypothetical protein CY34DRAFT_102102 [Suillus luteus UH-Slu-Lm8-n1]
MRTWALLSKFFCPCFVVRVLTLICLYSQERLHTGYRILTRTLPWLIKQSSDMDHDEYLSMIKTLRQGADGARGDDTSKLKTLVADWVNRDLKPTPLVDSDDKHSRGFINDACGRLLCPAELDWNNPATKAGIRDRSEGYTVTELSFPSFLYEKYTANVDNLEAGLFKGQILVQGYKAVFTSPSSAKDIEGDGDGADVIENNRRARKAGWGLKVKKHVAQIIKMDRVTPRSIAYIACQVRFALSSITSWRTVDGDFNYVQFWQSIVDFFERPPGRDANRQVDKLLEWWNRYRYHTGIVDKPRLTSLIRLGRFLVGPAVRTLVTQRSPACLSMLSQDRGHKSTTLLSIQTRIYCRYTYYIILIYFAI